MLVKEGTDDEKGVTFQNVKMSCTLMCLAHLCTHMQVTYNRKLILTYAYDIKSNMMRIWFIHLNGAKVGLSGIIFIHSGVDYFSVGREFPIVYMSILRPFSIYGWTRSEIISVISNYCFSGDNFLIHSPSLTTISPLRLRHGWVFT